MAISKDELEKILYEKFPNADIKLDDLLGDSDHYSLYIADSAFSGKKLIEQHKMVKEALKVALGSNLHAITIKTKAK